ncbi:MAG TPA: hypothetical protein VJ508_17250 [Saprospiraceae bacterium]|nr:hypothetical protein [Saprospiraceae bacterium]
MNISFTLRKTLLLLMVLVSSIGVSSAQNLEGMPVSTDYAGIIWRSPTEIGPILTNEHTRVAGVLSNQSLPAPDRAIYTAYSQLVDKIQNELPNSSPSGFAEMAVKSFTEILNQAPKDPVMKYIHAGLFRQQFDLLIEQLVEPNRPKAVTH